MTVIYPQFFWGLIDEVRVYNLPLTQAQIQADMNLPIGNDPDRAGQSSRHNGRAAARSIWAGPPPPPNLGVGAYVVERAPAGTSNFVQIGWPGQPTTMRAWPAAPISATEVFAVDAAGDAGPSSNVAQASTALAVKPKAVAVLTDHATPGCSASTSPTSR